MNSRLMPDQTDAHPHRWSSAGSAAARATDTKWRLCICSTHQSAPQTVAVSCQVVTKTPMRQLPVSPASHNHRAAPLAPGLNPHSARGTACNLLPRLRALALLRRRPHTRPARPSIRRPRNLHIFCPEHLQRYVRSRGQKNLGMEYRQRDSRRGRRQRRYEDTNTPRRLYLRRVSEMSAGIARRTSGSWTAMPAIIAIARGCNI